MKISILLALFIFFVGSSYAKYIDLENDSIKVIQKKK
jgi:hypothetical protein